MIDFLSGQGFLGTPASLGADLSLVVTSLAAILAIVGWRLAVAKRFSPHHWLLIAATALNATVALLWMAVSFVRYVVPGLPSILGDPPYALTAVHSAAGAAGLFLAALIIVRFSRSSPQRLRRMNAKRTMRIALILYLLTWLMGVVIYLVLYAGVPL